MSRSKTILLAIVALAALVGLGFVTYRAAAPKKVSLCQVCGRDVPKQTKFLIDTSRGTLTTCCPRCAMHYMLDHPGRIRGARATDYSSGRLIDAQSAYYDEGGELQFCTAHEPAFERGPSDGVRQRVYDRCLPVLVAFASRDEADAYQGKYGGRVLTYQQALSSVREQ